MLTSRLLLVRILGQKSFKLDGESEENVVAVSGLAATHLEFGIKRSTQKLEAASFRHSVVFLEFG
jgi:hypothetical protein